jgi:hypothetical protein
MYNSEIHIWLKDLNKDYTTGVNLYERYSDKKWLTLFSSGESSFTFNKLIEELDKLKGDEKEKPFSSGKTTPADFKRYTNPQKQAIDTSNFPPELKQLDIKKGELFREASYMHAIMCQLPDDSKHDAERKKMAERIIFLFEEIAKIWQQLDHFANTGKMLPQKKPKSINDFESLSRAELILKRQSIRSMISRAKKNGNTKKIEEYKKELSEIESFL